FSSLRAAKATFAINSGLKLFSIFRPPFRYFNTKNVSYSGLKNPVHYTPDLLKKMYYNTTLFFSPFAS
ncbi:MAG TPA: hypothetical protein VJL89_12355, partial [Thermodesulfovibrionia bacterium]|nr:hypothetical protein [Thermodesulfovibrionia bacterium]